MPKVGFQFSGFLVSFFLMSCNSAPMLSLLEKQPIHEVQVKVEPKVASSELVLKLNYQLDTNKQCEDGGLARIEYQGREIRANLFPELSEAQVALGKSPESTELVRVHYLAPLNCEVKYLKAEVRPVPQRVPSSIQPPYSELIEAHSPFVVVRHNQRKNLFTDRPIALAYSIHHPREEKTTVIRYTLYFTDEDSIETISGTESQMMKYGRRTDIEWVYEVELDERLQVIHRRYQGGIVFGLGHKTYEFQGEFLPKSQHPILYNVANHNVFSDSKSWIYNDTLDGYHLAPQFEIKHPEAREWVMFNNPWMFQVSDRELQRERKLAFPSTDYLFVLVDGTLPSGSLEAKVSLLKADRLLAAEHAQDMPSRFPQTFSMNLSEFGEDLWHRQVFTAVPMGAVSLGKIMAKTEHGAVELLKKSSQAFKLEALQFFRLVEKKGAYELENINHLFMCSDSGEKYRCLF
jgi:hypothetical protein